jgi:Rrf2 family protein
MKFSTRTTYGIRAMVSLARNQNGKSLPLSQIAQEENISLNYLERIFSILKKSEFVKAEKGAQGGYRLAKKAEDIRLNELLEKLEGDLVVFNCVNYNVRKACDAEANCGAAKVLAQIRIAVDKKLSEISLSDLVA